MNKEMTVSKILLPVAFSERCLGAARSAEFLACHFHAELIVLHVVTPPYVAYGEVNAYPPAADFYAEEWERRKQELEAFLSDAPAGIKVCRMMRDGDPAREIVQYADRGKFDLIVMPTHGYGPFRRFLLGSVTAKVLHDARCPVWTGPHLERAPDWPSFTLRRIACAVDLGPQSRAVLGWAAAMAREFSTDLVILHALPASAVTAGGLTFDPEWRYQLERNARKQITELQLELGIEGETEIDAGDVAQTLRELVLLRGADLLVIGRSHGAGMMGRLRAAAYSILRESPCPVLAI